MSILTSTRAQRVAPAPEPAAPAEAVGGTRCVLTNQSKGTVGTATAREGGMLAAHRSSELPVSPPFKLCSAVSTQYVAFAGADTVWVYAFDSERGALVGALNSARHLRLPPGSGPRHLDFHPSGKFVFVLCELSGMVHTCAWDGACGELAPHRPQPGGAGSVCAMPEGQACARAHHSGAAHILASGDGKTVYVATRTDNCLVVFSCSAGGELLPTQRVSTRGVCPRNFILDGDRLRLINQDSQSLVEWDVAKDGRLVEPPTVTPTPGVCGWVLCKA